ncbi:MAG: NAD(P)/FAD-dependent oxidoreductase [Candidatus Nealsonbacteria bacterium]
MYDLVIIGGGPAGITAGIYAARKKINTLLITKDFIGQAGKAFFVENYPGFERISGLELIKKFKNHLKKFEIEIKEVGVKKIRKVKNKFIVQTEKRENFISKTVILASGRDPRPLEVSGEKELIGRGISYCPTCDLPFFKNKEIAVIGGGNAGFNAAIEAVRYGNKVYILEFSPKVIAEEITQERAKETRKIKVILNAEVKKILGEKEVREIVYQDRISQKEKTLNVQGIFIMIGETPATDYIKGLVDFNEKDEIIVDPKNLQTKTEGLFACGDVTNVLCGQIVIAAGEGAKAALSAYEYLQKF